MRVPGLKSLRHSGRWLRSRFVRHGLILGYHRVCEAVHDPYSMCVSPGHFAEQLEVLSEQARVVSLSELVEGVETGKLPERAVAITFDDGYADMLCEIKPLLELYQIPATFFITTGYPGREFWWDELDRLLMSASNLPDQFPVAIQDWIELRDKTDTCTLRQRILRSLYDRLLPLTPGERERLMDQLRNKLGVEPARSPERRALTSDELKELADNELVEIGAHTMTHPMLAKLSVASQRTEILQSKSYLETVLDRPVTCFSYPNGSASEKTETIVRDAGFICACTSHNDVVWSRSNRYQLPRFWMPDLDGATFSGWVRRWSIKVF